jgi:hypothetical protein
MAIISRVLVERIQGLMINSGEAYLYRFSSQRRMRNKHRDIHIRPLPVEPEAISYELERQLYIWDSRVKLLRIA